MKNISGAIVWSETQIKVRKSRVKKCRCWNLPTESIRGVDE